jgi:hypothetical protein
MPLFPVPPAVQDALPAAARDFDFLRGSWRIHHRRLRHRLVGSTEWVEFETPFVMAPLLGGLGNIDQCRVEGPDAFFEGISLRFFDRGEAVWKIYWVDSDTGTLFPPVVGGFDGELGTFFGADRQDGVPVRVRFRWDRADRRAPRWEQAFSADDGTTWETNWVMEFRRPE